MKFISKRKEKKARRIEEKYAHANGFFWLPCPVCGEPFGGHEVDWDAVHAFVDSQDAPGYGALICPRCVGRHGGDASFQDSLDSSQVVQVHWWPKQDEEEGSA